MVELILDTDTLPTPLSQLLNTDKVRALVLNGEIRLVPILGSLSPSKPSDTPIADALLGVLKNSDIKSADDIKAMRLGV